MDIDLEILSDVELDVGFHSEFHVYLSDVELARIAQANRFNYVRFMVHAITAHRQVHRRRLVEAHRQQAAAWRHTANRRRLVEDNRHRVRYLRSELIRVLGLFPELRDEIIVVATD
jgi:SRSO17 transposase